MIERITALEAKQLMESNSTAKLIDVRELDEFKEGHIESAVSVPLSDFIIRTREELKDKNQALLVYCQSGKRSALAASILETMGYQNIHHLGSINEWPYEIVR